jgi:hypothetical protein
LSRKLSAPISGSENPAEEVSMARIKQPLHQRFDAQARVDTDKAVTLPEGLAQLVRAEAAGVVRDPAIAKY